MKDIIIVRPDKCVGCNACIRCCPAPEANIVKMLDNGKIYTTVNADKCIACGQCIEACTHGARDYVDDTAVFMSRISDSKYAIIVDPAIKTAFPNQWKGILEWFRKKSFLIFDGAFGADIYTWAMLGVVDSNNVGNVISESCSSVVNYISMYHPSLVQNLPPICSPTLCSAVYIKNYLRRNEKLVVLSPCIARKYECAETGLIDYNITFKKLMEYFEKNDIVIPKENYPNFEYESFERPGMIGGLCSRPGGLCDNLLNFNLDINAIYSSGTQRVADEISLYSRTEAKNLPSVFDMLSCDYGCGYGSGTDRSKKTSYEVIASFKAMEADIRSKAKNKGKLKFGDEKAFRKLDDELDLNDFVRTFTPRRASPVPTDADLEPIFEQMGKSTEAQRTINCGNCGFKTCRDLATAIYRGINIIQSCVNYSQQKSVVAADNAKIEEETKKYEELSAKISEKAKSISESISKIDEAGVKTAEKKDTVNELLKNIIAFCNKNTTMDENSVKQMATILETTMKSLESFDENIGVASENTKLVNDAIKQINSLIDSVKKNEE